MNDKFTNNVNSDDENIARKLSQVAEKTNVNAQFAAELEERLRNSHQPKMSWSESLFKQISPTLRWVALLILLALVLSWSIKTLIPAPQPAINNTSVPSDTATPTPEVVITVIVPTQSSGYDWRGTKLYLSAPLPELPAEANVSLLKDERPATIDTARALASQFGIQGKIFETPGRLPDTKGFMVTDGKQRLYVLSNIAYDYYFDYGSYSYMSGMSGAKNISDEEAASVIDAFMKSHGLTFEYKLENPHINPGKYYVLPLTADGLPIYHDYNIPARLEFIVNENDQVVLVTSYQVQNEVLGTYGIRTAEEAFQQILAQSNIIQNGVLEIMHSGGVSDTGFWSRTYPDNEPITIYGQPTSYPAAERNGTPFVSIGQFTATGNISGIENIDSSTYIEARGQFITENSIRRFNVDSWKVTEAAEVYLSGSLRREGDQAILTADDGSGEYKIGDAPSDLPINTTSNEYIMVYGFMAEGKLSWSSIEYSPSGSGGGGGGGNGTGFYQLNLSGTPVPFPSPTAEPDQGNVEYVIQEGDTVLSIAQTYRTTPEKIFQANSWLVEERVLMPGKTLIIPAVQTNSGSSEYIVQENDTLSSIALNFGITVDELMQANGITDPVIFVGQTLILPKGQLDQSPVGQKLEGLRGIFQVNAMQKSDGSQSIWYGFYDLDGKPSTYYILEGTDLQSLQAYNNLPIDLWGTVDHVDELGRPIVKVDRYEVPYPDLQFQILEGTQEINEIQGQSVILFTAKEGKTYVELTGIGTPFDQRGIFGKESDQILVEGLAIPDETFGGYPALRVFSMNYVIDPVSGLPNELSITANQVNIYEEPPTSIENYTPPTLTIEKVELVYYVPDPRYGNQNPNPAPHYIQPAWRFYGHYENGDEVEFLVQALKQEYLLPELAPYTPPG